MPQSRGNLIETKCAICDTFGNSEVVYEANITLDEIEIAPFLLEECQTEKLINGLNVEPADYFAPTQSLR